MLDKFYQYPQINLRGDKREAEKLLQDSGFLQLRTLKSLMSFQELQQDHRRVFFDNGSIVHCASIMGQDFIDIYAPFVPIPLEEEDFPEVSPFYFCYRLEPSSDATWWYPFEYDKIKKEITFEKKKSIYFPPSILINFHMLWDDVDGELDYWDFAKTSWNEEKERYELLHPGNIEHPTESNPNHMAVIYNYWQTTFRSIVSYPTVLCYWVNMDSVDNEKGFYLVQDVWHKQDYAIYHFWEEINEEGEIEIVEQLSSTNKVECIRGMLLMNDTFSLFLPCYPAHSQNHFVGGSGKMVRGKVAMSEDKKTFWYWNTLFPGIPLIWQFKWEEDKQQHVLDNRQEWANPDPSHYSLLPDFIDPQGIAYFATWETEKETTTDYDVGYYHQHSSWEVVLPKWNIASQAAEEERKSCESDYLSETIQELGLPTTVTSTATSYSFQASDSLFDREKEILDVIYGWASESGTYSAFNKWYAGFMHDEYSRNSIIEGLLFSYTYDESSYQYWEVDPDTQEYISWSNQYSRNSHSEDVHYPKIDRKSRLVEDYNYDRQGVYGGSPIITESHTRQGTVDLWGEQVMQMEVEEMPDPYTLAYELQALLLQTPDDFEIKYSHIREHQPYYPESFKITFNEIDHTLEFITNFKGVNSPYMQWDAWNGVALAKSPRKTI